VDRLQLEPVAEILVQAYLDTTSYSRQFHDDYDQPPTQMAKVHHMRSITQAMVNKSDRLSLAEPYIEFSRVEILDADTDRRYLLRSDGATVIERHFKQREALFDATPYITSDITMVVYRFHRNGLDLSVTGARHKAGKVHLEASGIPVYIATWPYSVGTPPFDQGGDDPFGDLGDLGDFGDGDT